MKVPIDKMEYHVAITKTNFKTEEDLWVLTWQGLQETPKTEKSKFPKSLATCIELNLEEATCH